MNMSITLASILIAMALEVRAVERGYTIVTATGGMFYDGGEWWQVAIAGMELALYSLAEDCETREQCQDQWQEDYWDAEGNFPIGNFQTEFGIAHFIAQNLNVGARVLIRPDDREDPLRYMWAWGAELAYFLPLDIPDLDHLSAQERIGRGGGGRLSNTGFAVVYPRQAG